MKLKIFVVAFILLFLLTACINKNCRVTFNSIGGSEVQPISVERGKTVDLPTPTKEGYRFIGWFSDLEYKDPFTEDSIVKRHITLYAKWEINQYQINFETNGGNQIDPITLDYQEQINITVVPEKVGNDFDGWYLDSDLTEKFNLKKMPANNLTLYAKWKQHTYHVSFDTNGGTSIPEQKVKHGEKLTRPEDPLRLDYTFVGWFIDEELTIPFDFNTSIESNMTLYAKWIQYLIHFDSNGGRELPPLVVNIGEEITEFPTPLKAGVTFNHWTYEGNPISDPFIFDFDHDITLKAVWITPYKTLKYMDGKQIYIPDNYVERTEDFRGMWVSNLTGDVASFSNKTQMMNQLTEVLNNLEAWNMNAIVYHIRINNDALYDTELSPKSKYVMNANFTEWDYLEWFIDECHKRGIEFHAWLNPYRITSSGATTKEAVMQTVANYPLNPANNPDNILLVNNGAILNPGEPAVRKFLIDTCMEVIEKYDVDAIHFDDYFYAAMPYENDIDTYNKYKGNSMTTNIDDWRREQVDIFIRDLHLAIEDFNTKNNRDVELGISPSGVWKSGDGIVKYDENGTAITNGSNTTTSFNHYGAYLYSDTKKWIDEEWIDYICPQVYWGFDHPSAPYADITDWWAKVVKYKDVKLYIGLGIYRASDASNTDSWRTNPYEFSDQVLYNTKLREVNGVIIFRYNFMKTLINQKNSGALRVINDYWKHKATTPK